MNAAGMINLVKKFTNKNGVKITWTEQTLVENSRGELVPSDTGVSKSATVLILKEKFNVLKPIETSVGISQDYSRYVFALPDVDIKKDMVITDNHGMKWKLGIVDWFDVGGVPVAKQSALTEVA